MNDFDPVEFGKLIQSVETLTSQVATLATKVEEMSNQMTGGKGLIAGMMLAAGGIGAGASELFSRIFK